MQWVWKHNIHLQKTFLEDMEMINLLSLLLVAEKLDQFIEQWIMVDLEPTVIQTLGVGGLYWRSTLWRALVSAELVLGGNSADAALLRMFAIQNLKTRALEASTDPLNGQFCRASAHPASITLVSQLTSGKYDSRGRFSETSPPLYGRLQGFISSGYTKGAVIDWMACKLALWHPTKPDANPVLDALRRNHNDLPNALNITSKRGRYSVYIQARRTAFLLRQRESFADADWVESLLPSLAPGFSESADGLVFRKYAHVSSQANPFNKLEPIVSAASLPRHNRNKPP